MFNHGEFHWRDGIYFSTQEDGAVRIRVERPDQPETLNETIPANEWASIILHVSHAQRSYEEAEWFHGRREIFQGATQAP